VKAHTRTGTAQVSAIAALLVLSALTPLAAQEPPPRVLTLAQAIDEAMQKNDRMISQHDAAERAGLAVRAARSAFTPKVVPNMHGSFGQTDVSDQSYRTDVSQKFVNGTEVRFGAGTSTAQVPDPLGLGDIRFYNSDTTLLVSQPLLKGFGSGVTRRSLTLAELQQAAAARQQKITEQQVAVDVAGAYYHVVAQEAMIGVARRGFDRARQLREASEAKLGAGLVSQLDVLRAQQLVSQAELQLFDSEAAAEDARDQLRFLIGADADAKFAIVPDIPKTIEDVTAEQAVSQAMANRPDVQTAVAEAADAERAIAYARNQLRPQFDLNLALTRRETADSLPRSFGLDKFQFATFFNISMPVDRTPQTVEFQSALIDRDRRQRDLDTLRRRIADDVRRQLRQRDRVLRSLTAAESNVQLAQQEVEVARLRYERGLSNNLDVVTAETNLLNVESLRILALADLATTRLSLRATLGTLDPRKDAVELSAAPRAEE
jgi:outer membrane protein TolC